MPQSDLAVIQLSAGPFRIDILPVGATLTRFRFRERDLILGFMDPLEHTPNSFYAGAIVGPIANRVTDGQVKIDAQTYQMECNENDSVVHSGTDGLHSLVWKVSETTKSAVTLTCQLRDGHNGLPGNRKITVTYALDETGLTLSIIATTDAKTPINIAHHPYWALEPDQSQTQLMINALAYLSKDGAGLPDGEIRPVVASMFDFTKPRALGPDAKFDHNWCLGTAKQEFPRHAATLIAKDGLQLDIDTTEVGLQVYTGSGLPLIDGSLCAGPQICPNAGIALEPQGWPDAPNQPDFPNILLDKDDIYRQITRYRVSKHSIT